MAAAPLTVSSTGQVAHALDEHVMTEPMEQGALLHEGVRTQNQRVLASSGIDGLASSSLSVMSGSKAEAKRAALKPTRQSMALRI